MAPVNCRHDASAGHAGRAAVPSTASSTQERQGGDRDPDLCRLLPALRVSAGLGPDRGDSSLSRPVDCAGTARHGADRRAARAAPRPGVETQGCGVTLLERYIAIATLKALALVSAGMTFLFSLLELVDQLRDVGK